MVNPITKYRKKREYTKSKLASLINSNFETIKNLEKGNCKDITAFEIIKKMAKHFDDIEEKEMVLKYLKYKNRDKKEIGKFDLEYFKPSL